MSKILLKEKREEAYHLINEIKKELSSANEILKLIKEEHSDVKKESSKIATINPKIESTIANAENGIVDLRKKRDNLKNLLSSTERYINNNFQSLKNKIDDPNEGLNAKLKKGKKFETSANSLNKNFQKASIKLSELKKESTDKIRDIRKTHYDLKLIDKSLRQIKQDIDGTNLEIEESKIKIDTAKNVILENERKVVDSSNIISRLQTESTSNSESIGEFKSEAESDLEKIKNIYGMAANAGLGGEFDKSRKHIEKNLKVWRIHIISATSLLFLFFILFFIFQLSIVDYDLSRVKINDAILTRLLMSAPIIFYLVFSTSQYNRNKMLYERYAYKTAISLSIEAHMSLLLRIDKQGDGMVSDKVLDFILSGFRKIYREPYKKIDKLNKNNFNSLNGIPSKIKESVLKQKVI